MGCSEPPPNPLPPLTFRDWHGTLMAGIIAAEGGNILNPLCSNTVGIAFDSRLAEIFTWDNGFPQTEMADSVLIYNSCIPVKAASYDITINEEFRSVDQVLRDALEDSATLGWSGLGTVQVIAGGNDGRFEYSARTDYDEFVSSRFTLAVGAISTDYQRWVTSSSGSEVGSSLMCCAPGDFMFAPGRLTQDNLEPHYNCAPGTSFAGPCVAAVIALMIGENPNLSWRDTYDAIVQTAATIDPGPDWHTNQAGNDHSYEYGHGLIDAFEAVSLVTGQNGHPTWMPLLGERMIVVPVNPNGFVIGPDDMKEIPVTPTANMRIEHVELAVNITTVGTPGIGPLEIEIDRMWPLSGSEDFGGRPKLTRSVFAVARTDPTQNYENLDSLDGNALFTSVRHWGETGTATWKVRLRNTSDSIDPVTATWNTAELRFYGTPKCIADWDMDGDSDAADDTAYRADYSNGLPHADRDVDQDVLDLEPLNNAEKSLSSPLQTVSSRAGKPAPLSIQSFHL